MRAKCPSAAPSHGHCTASTRSTTDLNRPPTDCYGTPAHGRATLSFRSSRWLLGAWRPTRASFGHGWFVPAIVAGIVIGKPVGIFLAAAAAVRAGIAVNPAEYTWRQSARAGVFAGIGFTMPLFMAGQALPSANDFSAKIAVFVASVLSAAVGTAVLLGGFAPGAFRRAAAERRHASTIALRRLCWAAYRRSCDESTY
jgi:hypothetical protein